MVRLEQVPPTQALPVHSLAEVHDSPFALRGSQIPLAQCNSLSQASGPQLPPSFWNVLTEHLPFKQTAYAPEGTTHSSPESQGSPACSVPTYTSEHVGSVAKENAPQLLLAAFAAATQLPAAAASYFTLAEPENMVANAVSADTLHWTRS